MKVFVLFAWFFIGDATDPVYTDRSYHILESREECHTAAKQIIPRIVQGSNVEVTQAGYQCIEVEKATRETI